MHIQFTFDVSGFRKMYSAKVDAIKNDVEMFTLILKFWCNDVLHIEKIPQTARIMN